jgi:hypothetical protein
VKLRWIAFSLFSIVFWAATIVFSLVAISGPCGLAPDERCELEGQGIFWFLDGIGPLTVLLIATPLYLALLALVIRSRKVR